MKNVADSSDTLLLIRQYGYGVSTLRILKSKIFGQKSTYSKEIVVFCE